jgi:hypothetical protein
VSNKLNRISKRFKRYLQNLEVWGLEKLDVVDADTRNGQINCIIDIEVNSVRYKNKMQNSSDPCTGCRPIIQDFSISSSHF